METDLTIKDQLMKVLTPREIVAELDKFIIGQNQAKRSVAIALRNRWRRQQVPRDLRDEIAPKNIIMIGPTGVGKTEIARRLARLARSPFLKVEATKFTEVGYVGRDVESMIRDLTELAANMAKQEEQEKVKARAHELAEERLNAEHGVKVDFLFEDTRSDAKVGEIRARKLIDEQGVSLVFAFPCAVVYKTQPIADKAGALLMACNMDPRTAKASPRTFRVFPNLA